MPELPEVETIKNRLQREILNKTIRYVLLTLPRILENSDAELLGKNLRGRCIHTLIRRGKYLVFALDQGALIFHLGMTGRLLYDSGEIGKKAGHLGIVPKKLVDERLRADKHTHMAIIFQETGCLLFRDVRTFGRVIHVSGGDWRAHPRIARLGPEPLEIKTASFLTAVLPLKTHRAVKGVLMGQSLLCGLGNIYCDEALFSAGIHPGRPACGLSQEEWKKLIGSIKQVLRKAIRNCGTTFSDYRQPNGAPGANRDKLLVYGRAGEHCFRCKFKLKKMVLDQRTTVFCPKCQPVTGIKK